MALAKRPKATETTWMVNGKMTNLSDMQSRRRLEKNPRSVQEYGRKVGRSKIEKKPQVSSGIWKEGRK